MVASVSNRDVDRGLSALALNAAHPWYPYFARLYQPERQRNPFLIDARQELSSLLQYHETIDGIGHDGLGSSGGSALIAGQILVTGAWLTSCF